jgi:hypothetical protein
VLNFKATGGKQEKTKFLLSLVAETEALMTKRNWEGDVLGGGFKKSRPSISRYAQGIQHRHDRTGRTVDARSAVFV